MLTDEITKFAGVVDEFAVHALANALEDFVGGAHADVGANELIFELFEQIGIDLLFAVDGVFNRLHQSGAGLLNALLETVEETATGEG
jgi:hypothetical protein